MAGPVVLDRPPRVPGVPTSEPDRQGGHDAGCRAYDQWDDTAICWILGEKYKYTIPFTIHWHESWQIIDLDINEAVKHPFVRVKNSSDRSRDVSDWFKLENTLDIYKNLKN
jgi:hypothetical protein